MNLRQNKRRVVALQHHIILAGQWDRIMERWAARFDAIPLAPNPAFERLLADMFPAQPDPVEAAKVEFVCMKVKDGEVVDTFDTREEALALVLKHARQKKAKLQVMNSLTGALEVFTETEMA